MRDWLLLLVRSAATCHSLIQRLITRNLPTLVQPTRNRTSAHHSHLIGLDRPILHVQIPDLYRQVVSGHHVVSIVAKLDV